MTFIRCSAFLVALRFDVLIIRVKPNGISVEAIDKVNHLASSCGGAFVFGLSVTLSPYHRPSSLVAGTVRHQLHPVAIPGVYVIVIANS